LAALLRCGLRENASRDALTSPTLARYPLKTLSSASSGELSSKPSIPENARPRWTTMDKPPHRALPDPCRATVARSDRSGAFRRAGLFVAGLLVSGAGWAIDYGPFSLNGFVKVEYGRGSDACPNCQLFPNEGRERPWADAVVPGAEVKNAGAWLTLLQPYLGVKFDLPQGFKIQGLASQRWRDGKVDIEGSYYEMNVAISHEEYGSLRFGAFPTRAWAFADFPFGSDYSGGDTWASSGAGYGLNTEALRYTARTLDVYDGDLVLELTYDWGDTDFKRNTPRFIDFWARYFRGDLKLDFMYQDTRNGPPSSWGHAPFTAVFYDPQYDEKIGGSGQSMAMLQGSYQITPSIDIGFGIRRNRWSGSYAVCIDFIDGQCRYNNFFNVDFFGTDANGVQSPGYKLTSYDYTAGVRWQNGPWSLSTGLVYLSEGSTDNPAQRGQDNSLLKGSLGGGYNFGNGLVAYASVSAYAFGQDPQAWGCNVLENRPADSCTLGPRSWPSNAPGGNDARVSRYSHGFSLGATYSF
jgi:hypothetical protein